MHKVAISKSNAETILVFDENIESDLDLVNLDLYKWDEFIEKYIPRRSVLNESGITMEKIYTPERIKILSEFKFKNEYIQLLEYPENSGEYNIYIARPKSLSKYSDNCAGQFYASDIFKAVEFLANSNY
ncbi:hypothetical protein [Flavobacterium sp. HSC-61S13]|uniref:hypothetical protein n=1 Tax=Flavobacterium sp. HSC-61S13 TaxID=2910963 RepID=UPI00209D63B8|nr:hypothetical protein [Flavobacterium sp. HSC-61S13]MCP1997283.1 hypothetical protein [Flavobacterium sp. HSC-61S13]